MERTLGLHILILLELKDQYELDIKDRGIKLNHVDGSAIECSFKLMLLKVDFKFTFCIKLILDFVVSTDAQHPSISPHQLTLALRNLAPLVVRVPWPFLVDGIVPLLQEKKKKKWVHLVLKKNLDGPWPQNLITTAR